MNVRERCGNMVLQLRVWRQELFDVAITAERFHSPGKDVIQPELTELMKLIDSIGRKIDEFERKCPEDLEKAA